MYVYQLHKNEECNSELFIKEEESEWDKIYTKGVINCAEIKCGHVLDVKDLNGDFYPAKVVSRIDRYITVHYKGWQYIFDEKIDLSCEMDRIAPYCSKCNEYGISSYTYEYVQNKILNNYQRIERENNQDNSIKVGNFVYIEYPYISNTGNIDVEYAEAIVESVDTDNGNAGVSFNDSYNREIITVSINCVKTTPPARYIRYERQDKNTSVYINTQRKVLEDENNIICKITNSFISDFSRCTVFSNTNADM